MRNTRKLITLIISFSVFFAFLGLIARQSLRDAERGRYLRQRIEAAESRAPTVSCAPGMVPQPGRGCTAYSYLGAPLAQ